MSYGTFKVFQTSIASGAATANFDLGPRGWRKVFLDVGSMSTQSGMNILGGTVAGTYRQIFVQPATNVVSYITYHISGLSSGMVQMPVYLQYLQIAATSVVSGGVSMSIICSD